MSALAVVDFKRVIRTLDTQARIENVGAVVGVLCALNTWMRGQKFGSVEEAISRAPQDFWPKVCASTDIPIYAHSILVPLDISPSVRHIWANHQLPIPDDGYQFPIKSDPGMPLVIRQLSVRLKLQEDWDKVHQFAWAIYDSLTTGARDRFPPTGMLPPTLEKIAKAIECEICFEAMAEPVRIDACGHVFCRVCLEKWVEGGRGGTRQCPKCRAAFDV